MSEHLSYIEVEWTNTVALLESTLCQGRKANFSEIFLCAEAPSPFLTELAEKYGKSSAQIILRWQLQAGFIAIPGSSNPDHIAENYDIFDFELSEEDMQMICGLDRHERYENW